MVGRESLREQPSMRNGETLTQVAERRQKHLFRENPYRSRDACRMAPMRRGERSGGEWMMIRSLGRSLGGSNYSST